MTSLTCDVLTRVLDKLGNMDARYEQLSASSSGICMNHLEQPTRLQLHLWLNVNQAGSSVPTALRFPVSFFLKNCRCNCGVKSDLL